MKTNLLGLTADAIRSSLLKTHLFHVYSQMIINFHIEDEETTWAWSNCQVNALALLLFYLFIVFIYHRTFPFPPYPYCSIRLTSSIKFSIVMSEDPVPSERRLLLLELTIDEPSFRMLPPRAKLEARRLRVVL